MTDCLQLLKESADEIARTESNKGKATKKSKGRIKGGKKKKKNDALT